ncbi:MAG: hypothetical protein EPO32_12945 [Anaerolineae bacterium]|nr:MAG: hypothetical protein EPO32_12945 [Anaerolineae bacterium]
MLLAIHDRLPGQFADSDADLFIHWGERADLPASVYPLAEESLVVVLSRDNPVRRLTAAEAQSIFTGRARNWTEFGGDDLAIQPWALADGSDAQAVFEDFLVGNGLLAAETRLAATLARMLAEVDADPAAIAAVPAAWVTPDVRAIALGDSRPILVFSDEEPGGDAAALLACLQGETGQVLLGEIYP